MQKDNDENDLELVNNPSSRLFSILELLGDVGIISVFDIVTILDIPRPTAHRLLKNLECLGFIQKSPFKGKYTASSKLTNLSFSILSSSSIYAPLKVLMKGLNKKTGFSVSFGVFHSGEVKFVASVEGSTRAQHIQPGLSVDLHTSSIAHVMVASWSEEMLETYLATAPWEKKTDKTIVEASDMREHINLIRKNGYAINESGNVLGLIGISVPVFDKNRNAVAGLSLSMKESEYLEIDLKSLIHTMMMYSNKMSKLF